MPSGSSADNEGAVDAVTTVVDVIDSSSNPTATFSDFGLVNFVTEEQDLGMSQSSRKRSTSPSSRELAARVELLLIESATGNEAEVV